MEETDTVDGSASFAPEKINVQPTGPPVQAAQTRLTVFQVIVVYVVEYCSLYIDTLLQDGGAPRVSESVRKRLDDVRRTLPDILGQVSLSIHTHNTIQCHAMPCIVPMIIRT